MANTKNAPNFQRVNQRLQEATDTEELKRVLEELALYPEQALKEMASIPRDEVWKVFDAFDRLRYLQGMVLVLRRNHEAARVGFHMALDEVLISFVDLVLSVPQTLTLMGQAIGKIGSLLKQYVPGSSYVSRVVSWIVGKLWGAALTSFKVLFEILESLAGKIRELAWRGAKSVYQWGAVFHGATPLFADRIYSPGAGDFKFFVGVLAGTVELFVRIFLKLVTLAALFLASLIGALHQAVFGMMNRVSLHMLGELGEAGASAGIQGMLEEKAKAMAAPFLTAPELITDYAESVYAQGQKSFSDAAWEYLGKPILLAPINTALDAIPDEVIIEATLPNSPPDQKSNQPIPKSQLTEAAESFSKTIRAYQPKGPMDKLPSRESWLKQMGKHFDDADEFDLEAAKVLRVALEASRNLELPKGRRAEQDLKIVSSVFKSRFRLEMAQDQEAYWWENFFNVLKLISVLLQGVLFGAVYAVEKGSRAVFFVVAKKMGFKLAWNWDLTNFFQIFVNFFDLGFRIGGLMAKDYVRMGTASQDLHIVLFRLFKKKAS